MNDTKTERENRATEVAVFSLFQRFMQSAVLAFSDVYP